MEFFILLGGLISLPLIKYINTPIKPQQPSIPSENPPSVSETPPKLSEQALKAKEKLIEDQIKQAQIRREKILSPLTDHERELFLDYIESLKDPKPKKSYESCLACVGISTLITVIVLAAYTIFTAHLTKRTPDL